MKLYLRETLFCLFVVAAGCTSEASDQAMNADIDQETTQALEDIANARIFFAHHSVGANLIAGLDDLAQEAGVTIRFVELGSGKIPDETPVFMHAGPGRNGFPKEKMDDFFAGLLTEVNKLRPDLALMKLCYVDIQPDTDSRALAEYYGSKIEDARATLGDTVLVHVTTPLTSTPNDLTSQFKALFGKGPIVWEDRSNKKRQVYNEQITRDFADDPVFDLAVAESTAPDGHRIAHGEGSDVYYSMWPKYTDDGGHLNELGRRVVAKAFALSLASALRARQVPEPKAVTPQ